MVSLSFNMLENYSNACQMPGPHTYLKICHHGKLSFTRVTERAEEGGTLNFKWLLPLLSVANKAIKEGADLPKGEKFKNTDFVLIEKSR